jgi:two-component system OmpR family response regulator
MSLPEPAARILVVDDEDNITFLLDATLRHFGFDIRVARTGRDALTAVTDFAPDLVLLDVMLPDLDGFEVVRRPPLRRGAGARAVPDGQGHDR